MQLLKTFTNTKKFCPRRVSILQGAEKKALEKVFLIERPTYLEEV
jgi:hypothetical protein